MSDAENDFGSAGDMISGSQNPQEHNDWLDQQQKARQKALEQQHKALEQPSSALSKPPAGFKPSPAEPVPTQTELSVSPITPMDTTEPGEHHDDTGLSGTVSAFSELNVSPEDAYVKLGRRRGQAMMINQYDDRKGPYRWTGHAYQGKERQEVLDRRKGYILDLPDDVQDCLFRFNCRIDPHFRQKAANALKEWNALPQLVDGPEKTTPAAAVSAVPAEAKTKPSLTEQVARVNEPGDESMTLLYQQGLKLFSEAFGKDKAVTGYGRAYPTHSDPGMAPVYRAIGQTAENALGRANAVNGNGTRPPGHLDESMGPAEGELFRNMNHDAVAKAQQAISQAEGFTYDREHGTREAYSFLKGIYMIPAEIKIGLYGLASLGGELIYRVAGGDPTGLRKVQQTLKQYQQEMAALKPLTLDSLYVKGRPDQTMQNVTDYLY